MVNTQEQLKEIVIEKNQHNELFLDLSPKDTKQYAESCSVTYRYILKEASSLSLKIFSVGDHSMAPRVEVILQGQGASATIHGCYALTGTAQQKIELVQEHQAPHTKSFSLLHSALTDQADFVYHGIIKVAQEAHGANAALYNKNILLSSTAKVVAVPSLEVLTNAVHCKHGTATSSFDSEQLFYLQSRGLSLNKAKGILLAAFFGNEFSIELTDRDRLIQQLLTNS